MIEDENFDAIEEALEVTDRGAEIMKKEPVSKPVKKIKSGKEDLTKDYEYSSCLLYTSPSPRDATLSRMPSSA